MFSVVNEAMFNPARRKPGAAAAAATTISPELQTCMPYIKFLDAALEALPPAYASSARCGAASSGSTRRPRSTTRKATSPPERC